MTPPRNAVAKTNGVYGECGECADRGRMVRCKTSRSSIAEFIPIKHKIGNPVVIEIEIITATRT